MIPGETPVSYFTMTDYLFPTRAAEEAAIERMAAVAARRTRQAFAMARIDASDAPATDIWDECRDHAYDLLREAGGESLVDQYLIDVTDIAADKVMGA